MSKVKFFQTGQGDTPASPLKYEPWISLQDSKDDERKAKIEGMKQCLSLCNDFLDHRSRVPEDTDIDVFTVTCIKECILLMIEEEEMND